MTATFARRLDALYAFARRVSAGEGGPALVEALEAVLVATSARACLAFGVEGALEPVAERGILVRAGVDAQAVKRALYRLASHAATTRRALVLADTRLESHVAEAADLARAAIGAVVFEPVIYHRTVLAVLVAVFDYPSHLDESASQQLATVAHLTALSLSLPARPEPASPAERYAEPPLSAVALVAGTVSREIDAPSNALSLQHQALGQIVEHLTLLSQSGVTEINALTSELDELTQEIGLAVARLQQASDRLRAMSNADNPFGELDLSDVARRALAPLRPLLTKRGVLLEELYGARCVLLGRAEELAQVVHNLVLNAAEAVEGRTDRQISVRVHTDAKHVWLVVEDTGPGVPPDQVKNIFRPFYTTKQHARGAGLGLKVARDVVAAHGGHIEVHARYGGGASFRVVLPRAVPDHESVSRSRPRATNEAEVQIRETDTVYRVLVVDDDPIFSRTLRRGLKPHEVLTASSASEAEMLLLDAGYDADLIVCDLSLPGANGDVLHQRIQAKRPDLAARFVFVTGAALGKAEADYLKASGCLSLLKPVDAPQLLAVLEARRSDPASAPPHSVRTLADPPESERPTLIPPRGP
jgi:signal transduction histidine kinase/ActR/RegA family two-component response regulator